MILNVNLQKSFLSSNQMEEFSTLLVEYLDQEQDVRGLVQEKGWAHSMAHVADALDELVKQPSVPSETLEIIFRAIFDKMAFNKDYFHHDEEERMVIPNIAMLQRGLNESMVCGKIAELTNDLKQKFSTGDHPYLVYRANIKQFLGSLYFHLDHNEQNAETQHSIKQGLSEINQPYYQM